MSFAAVPGAWPAEPVLVLGAGPVGQTTALLLARWGIPTVLLDRRPDRASVGSVVTEEVWDAVGVGRATAGELLDRRIADEPLVDLRWAHQVSAVGQDAFGVTARLADRDPIPGSYLVDCGGAGLRASDRLHRGRVLLAGPAARPFGEGSLDRGVADAENAAWKIAYVAHGWAPYALLATYAAERAAPGHYADSPLTTPGAGMMLPDAEVATPTGGRGRLRALARDGFVLLAGPDADAAAVREAAGVMPGPTRVLELATLDPDGSLTAALDARPDQVWIVRPDAHVAAVLAAPGYLDLAAALARAAAHVTIQRMDLVPANG
jgi:hypothetical protein